MKTRKYVLNNVRLLAAMLVATAAMTTAVLAADAAPAAAAATQAPAAPAQIQIDPRNQVSPEDVAKSAGYCQYVYQYVCNPFTGICVYQYVWVCF